MNRYLNAESLEWLYINQTMFSNAKELYITLFDGLTKV